MPVRAGSGGLAAPEKNVAEIPVPPAVRAQCGGTCAGQQQSPTDCRSVTIRSFAVEVRSGKKHPTGWNAGWTSETAATDGQDGADDGPVTGDCAGCGRFRQQGGFVLEYRGIQCNRI